jgi:hypothetical protein
MFKTLGFFISLSFFSCSANHQQPTLIGAWQLTYIRDGKGNTEEDEIWRKQLADQAYADELEIISDSVLVHRFRKGNEKWTEIKNHYTLSSDKSKILDNESEPSSLTRILLLTADSLKLQETNNDIQAYFRKQE